MACLSEQLGMEFSPEEIADCKKRNGLLSMELELSRVCDLRCVYCYAASGTPLENELSFEELCNVVDQAVELGAKKIIVLGGGEPLLYPRLFDIIDHIKSYNLIVDMFTNGQTMDEQKAAELHRRGVGIVLKMNSTKPAVQDYLAGREGAYDAIQRAYQALKAAGYPDENCSLGVQTVICQQNYDELPDIWRWARDRSIAPYVEAMTMQGRANEHLELAVTSDQAREMFELLAQIDRDEYKCNWLPHPPLVASQCARHEYSCTVTSIGNVQPCVGVDLAAGNVRQQSLKEIIETSQVMQDLRNIRQTIQGKCAACEIADRCYGCRGHAYQVENNYLASDPLCWFEPTKKE